ncbi:hypothetical protein WJX73_000727 [Symbiochloris irregularis]|uniref:Malonyl-CoA:ACP transacylase (MAT) domain-containing protein n=1 Tax=Symbiochloris irregularis TaxID=706552 RepID=A0AAW1NUW0_9CHLO
MLIQATCSSSSRCPPTQSRTDLLASTSTTSARFHGASLATQAAAAAEPATGNRFADYKPSTAFYFPGQGAQSVGMAKDVVNEVPAAKQLFQTASDILGYDLLKICTEGPKDKLDSTEISQPAIYVASFAALEKLKQTEGEELIQKADVACGLSLGEYTALAFAGAFSFEDGLKLVKLRGESMQAAANASPSAMISVIGLDSDKVAALCEKASAESGAEVGVRIANFLCNGNYAISGSLEACEAAEKLAKEFGARKMVRLQVAGAFHTSFMQPAEEQLREALKATTINTPRIPVISNVDVQPHDSPDRTRDTLARQLTSPVQWETTMQTLLQKGVQNSYEIGPGAVISGIMRRIDRKHDVINIQV